MSSTSKQQLILMIEGLDVEESTLFNGLLYQISILKSSICSQKRRSCLYFTNSLAGDYTIDDVDHIETEKEMFQWIEHTADRIVKQNYCLYFFTSWGINSLSKGDSSICKN